MEMENFDWIQGLGLLGAFMSSITFIPQVYKVWETKSVNDLSLVMIFIVFASTLVWLVYAFALMLWPVIIANSIVCILSMFLIYFKFAYQK